MQTIETSTHSGGKVRRVVAVLFHSVLTSLYFSASVYLSACQCWGNAQLIIKI
jgi:hypothetical protein